MNVLIIGNLGYIGPVVVDRLRKNEPEMKINGFDIAYFANALTTGERSPETELNAQFYGDVRQFPKRILNGIDSIVYLAAISNDPMGNEFESVTEDVNHRAAVRIAEMAKASNVGSFVFASSCSVYGSNDQKPRDESAELNPLTAYAKSKIAAENALRKLSGKNFTVTALRFATACGASPRMRLDLVLNDFVATAMTKGIIEILSDGTPWRPLIHVKDMARLIHWAIERPAECGGSFLTINSGSDEWNYQISELAEHIRGFFPNLTISVNKDAAPDKRSYQVSFRRLKELAPNAYPSISLEEAIVDLKETLARIRFCDTDFRNSNLIRLNMLRSLIKSGFLDHDLTWR